MSRTFGRETCERCGAPLKQGDPLTRCPACSEAKPQSLSLAERIAVALLTPHGGPECHRLQIMQRLEPDGTRFPHYERDMGGHNKQSIIDVINRVIAGHL